MPTNRPPISVFVPNGIDVVPPFNHIDGHRRKQLSHFAQTAENENVAILSVGIKDSEFLAKQKILGVEVE